MAMAAPAAAGAASRAAAAAAKPRPKYGPGSRGATAGKPKASDALPRRSPAGGAGNAPADYDPDKVPLPKPMPASGAQPSSSGFRAGLSEGRDLAPRGGVNEGAGALLGLLMWVWVVLPMVHGGPSRVRDTLRAKFTNKGPSGEELL